MIHLKVTIFSSIPMLVLRLHFNHVTLIQYCNQTVLMWLKTENVVHQIETINSVNVAFSNVNALL